MFVRFGGGGDRVGSLQDHALLPPSAPLLPREQGSASRMLEDLAHAFVRLGRALEVLLRADLLADVFGLCGEWSAT